jgi:hypothetical protein
MTEITPEQHQLMESAIDQAIEFLNKEIPDWKSKINWNIFDFYSTRLCIAGQLEIPFRSNQGFYVPESITSELSYFLTKNAYHYMGEIWKQKAKPV